MKLGARLFAHAAFCSPLALAGALACSSSDGPDDTNTIEPPGNCPQLAANETCFEAEVDFITARFDRAHIVLAAGQTRSVSTTARDFPTRHG